MKHKILCENLIDTQRSLMSELLDEIKLEELVAYTDEEIEVGHPMETSYLKGYNNAINDLEEIKNKLRKKYGIKRK